MTTRRKIVKTRRSDGRLYLTKAQQFCAEATTAIMSPRNDAAMLNAVHAAISAADAVCVALGGRRSSDPNHQRAADLLQEIGGKSTDVSGQVRRLRELVSKKNAVEYESRLATAREATGAVQTAERFVAWASQTIDAARL
jgi:HEPN domain-containing protein